LNSSAIVERSNSGTKGIYRLWRRSDGSANDDMRCAGLGCDSWRCNANLIGCGRSGQLNSRANDKRLLWQCATQICCFVRGGHDPVTSSIASEGGKAEYLAFNRRRKADLGKIVVCQARDDGESKNAKLRKGFCGRHGCTKDRRARRCMNSDQRGAKFAGGFDRARDRVGNLVELEVEENVLALLHQLAYHRRPGLGEQLQPDLVVFRIWPEPPNQGHGISGGLKVKANDDG